MDKTSRIGSIFAFLIVILIVGGILLFGPNAREGDYAVVGEEVIQLTLADDEGERIRGLSGRESIGLREGMLFIFEEEDLHGIWMNDMNFAIDILWLQEVSPGTVQVIDLEENVQPETFPDVFLPEEPARYVLELAGGASEVYGIGRRTEIELFIE